MLEECQKQNQRCENKQTWTLKNNYRGQRVEACANDEAADKTVKVMYGYKNRKSINLATSILYNKSNYMNFCVPKSQPQISRMSFPYFLQDDAIVTTIQKPKAEEVKIDNRVFTCKKQMHTSSDFNLSKVMSQQPPINEFLNYQLSKQINKNLFEVKVLAHEIKKIKQQKLEQLQQKDKYKPNNKIRITKNFKSVNFLQRTKYENQGKTSGNRWS